MRRLFVLFALGACTPHNAGGPAWPKLASSDKDAKDGGESLAPQGSRQVAVAVEKSAEEVKPVAPAAEAKPAAAVAPVPEVGAPATAPVAPPEEGIMGEDITIEIDD